MEKTSTKSQKTLKVALLFESIKSAQDISNCLREHGIFAHYYQTQDEFWIACNQDKPDLAIVDVATSIEAAVPLSSHPLVRSSEIEIALYYSEENKHLLTPFFNTTTIGFVREEINIKGQVLSLLNRFEKTHNLVSKLDRSKRNFEIQQKKAQKIIEEVHEVYNFEQQFAKLNSLMNQFSPVDSKEEFLKQLGYIFTAWADCENFTILELSSSRKRVENPRILSEKYIYISPVGLDRKCDDGLEPFAVNMACQVGMEMLGHEMKVLPIVGDQKNPTMVLLIKTAPGSAVDFQWDVLSNFLSLKWRDTLTLSLKKAPLEARPEENIWRAMDMMDEVQSRGGQKYKSVVINLRPLLDFVQAKASNRFQWGDFYQDFHMSLRNLISEEGLLIEDGLFDCLLFLNIETVDKSFQLVKDFVRHFEYWHYFYHQDELIREENFPQIQVLAQSSVNYIRKSRNANVAQAGRSTLVARPSAEA